ncbi:MAG: glutamate--cysteine ligase [Deltaproteobacteria bacterium]|nr:glutamate--cysteine ligase [Deltaproteobacteria bacterium]
MKAFHELHNFVQEQQSQISNWFDAQWKNLKPLPYFSCDIRHSGFKIGIVDTNLFPGGFNNLCASYSRKAETALQQYFKNNHPTAKKIALLAESHTRNKFYLLNVLRLQQFIIDAGLECNVTMADLPDHLEERTTIPLDQDKTLVVLKPHLDDQNKIVLGEDFLPDLILSNNDFSAGVPQPFAECQTPLIPDSNLGWHTRRKNTHFKILSELFDAFGKEFNIDAWHLTPISKTVSGVAPDQLEHLASEVDVLISEITQKYKEYQISETPHVFIKNDSGTYGMGVLMVNSGQDVLELNRKKKNKLFSSRSDQANQFLLQEGIPTSDSYSGYPIEPVIYGIGKGGVGGFFRFHTRKSPYESLNSPGMSFSCLCLHKLDEPHESDFIDCKAKRELVFLSNFLAEFAALAAAKEA